MKYEYKIVAYGDNCSTTEWIQLTEEEANLIQAVTHKVVAPDGSGLWIDFDSKRPVTGKEGK